MAHTPRNWLSDLAESLSNATGKIRQEKATLEATLAATQDLLRETRKRGGTAWWVGNGGSNALCSHLSQDMLNKLKLRSMNLSDAPLLTCMANDFGYENIYARPLETLAREGDLLIAVSSSGKSRNILACVELAKRKKMSVIALSAFSTENPLWQMAADVSLFLPTQLYGIAEVGHEALLHSAIETVWLEEKTS